MQRPGVRPSVVQIRRDRDDLIEDDGVAEFPNCQAEEEAEDHGIDFRGSESLLNRSLGCCGAAHVSGEAGRFGVAPDVRRRIGLLRSTSLRRWLRAWKLAGSQM